MKRVLSQAELNTVILKTLEWPCVVCGAASEIVVEYEPVRKDLFEITDDHIYFPVCEACRRKGLDLQQIEKEALAAIMHRKV